MEDTRPVGDRLRARCYTPARVASPANRNQWRRPGVWGAIAAPLWPILFFAERVVPWRGAVRATGNDFPYLYFAPKAYLLDVLAHGSFPLWSPAEGAGFPFYSNPFAQAFYPLNAPLLLFRVLAGGYSSYDHQLYTLLGVSCFALGTYLWLRALRLSVAAALFGACLVSTSFKIADILRFPNAVHAAAWYPWLLLAFTRAVAARGRKSLALWLAGIFAFALALVTAGYPYFVYYSPVLFGPYLLLAARSAGPLLSLSAVRRLALITGAGALAVLACSPYLVKMKQLLDATPRPGGSVQYSMGFGIRSSDSLYSLFFPIAANLEGCFYVGTAGLLLVIVYLRDLVSRALAERRLARDAPAHESAWPLGELGRALLALAWLVVVCYVSWGEESGLFALLWRWLPGFSRLRAWGRLSIVLLPVLAWLLAAAFDHFVMRIRVPAAGEGSGARGTVATLLATYSIVAAAQLLVFASGRSHQYYRDFFPELQARAPWFLIGGAASFLVLWALLRGAWRQGPRSGAVLGLLLAVTVIDVWPVGSRVWTYRGPMPQREPFQVAAVVSQSLVVPRQATHGTISMSFAFDSPRTPFSPAFNVAVIPDWYFQSYWSFLGRFREESEALARLIGLRDGRRLYLSSEVHQDRLAEFLTDADSFDGALAVRSYTGDRLEVQVKMERPGYLTFVDNWDPDWHAEIDGRPTPLSVAFGTFKAVYVPAGEHQVVFRYAPWRDGSPAAAATSGGGGST